MADHQLENMISRAHKAQKERSASNQTPTPTPADPHSMSPMDLQRLVGNQRTQSILTKRDQASARAGMPSFIQTKLSVGAADDKYEVEADRVAKDVMSAPADTNQVSRQEDDAVAMMRIQRAEEDELATKRMDIQRADDDEMAMKRMDIQRADDDEMAMKRMDIQRADDDELAMKRADIMRADDDEMAMKRMEVQRADDDEIAMKGTDMRGAFEVGGGIEDSISSAKGGGNSMPDTSRDFFESRMGYDFSGVKIHSGGESDSLNRSLSAKAFTTGSDIFFRQGEYNPDSSGGKELLAHELTHVVQQGAAGPKAQRKEEN